MLRGEKRGGTTPPKIPYTREYAYIHLSPLLLHPFSLVKRFLFCSFHYLAKTLAVKGIWYGNMMRNNFGTRKVVPGLFPNSSTTMGHFRYYARICVSRYPLSFFYYHLVLYRKTCFVCRSWHENADMEALPLPTSKTSCWIFENHVGADCWGWNLLKMGIIYISKIWLQAPGADMERNPIDGKKFFPLSGMNSPEAERKIHFIPLCNFTKRRPSTKILRHFDEALHVPLS